MTSNTFMRVDDVAAELGVSKSYAYKIVQKLKELLKYCGNGRFSTQSQVYQEIPVMLFVSRFFVRSIPTGCREEPNFVVNTLFRQAVKDINTAKDRKSVV